MVNHSKDQLMILEVDFKSHPKQKSDGRRIS
jgi:hypothetical protein